MEERVFRRGIGIEGVCSEIGAIGDENFVVSRDRLIEGLCYRFGVDLNDVEYAIERAIEVGAVIVLENGFLKMNQRRV